MGGVEWSRYLANNVDTLDVALLDLPAEPQIDAFKMAVGSVVRGETIHPNTVRMHADIDALLARETKPTHGTSRGPQEGFRGGATHGRVGASQTPLPISGSGS